MNTWKPLELNRSDSRPVPGQLVVMRMVPSNGSATFYKDARYDVGKFETDTSTGRKLWWHSNHGTRDPVKLKRHYHIWWCPVQPFDM